jgi:hypothetical protein
MKKLFLTAAFCIPASIGFAQANLISYEDLKYILHNNLMKADTFLASKGYTVKDKNDKKKTRDYYLATQNGTHVDLQMRADGRKLTMELETNDISQYNMIVNSISQYINKQASTPDMQAFVVKDLCSIYVTALDSVHYNPMKKDYDMQIVADKNVTAID